jgi:hypothetical protein
VEWMASRDSVLGHHGVIEEQGAGREAVRMEDLPFNPGRRETLNIRNNHLLILLRSLHHKLPLLGSIFLNMRLSSGADDFDH